MSLTSNELNYLVWRYLQESGLDLAAYALDKHANCLILEKENISLVSRIEPGCLVSLVQKGIFYSLAQQEVCGSDGVDDRLTLFGALVEEEKQRRNGKPVVLLDSGNDTNNDSFPLKSENTNQNDEIDKSFANNNPLNYTSSNSNNTTTINDMTSYASNSKNNGTSFNREIGLHVEFETRVLKPSIDFDESLSCDWHPTIDVFAYGKLDSNAVINAIKDGQISESVTLNHLNVIETTNEINIVTWAPQGNLIVTSGANGELRAWSPDGKLINLANSLSEDLIIANNLNNASNFTSSIIKLLWSDSGQFLLSIDSFMRVCLWDGTNLNPIKQISPPVEASPENFIIDACWLGESKFAISTLKNSIKIYSITPFGSTYDLQSIGYLHGHENNISNLILDQSSRLLASSSDYDYEIKIWTNGVSQESLNINSKVSNNPNIKPHTSPIINMYWLHDKQNQSYLLTLSMEGVINLWNGNLGENVLSVEIFKNKANFKLSTKNQENNHDYLIFNSTISPNKQILAIGNDYGGVSFWDINLDNYLFNQSNNILRCLGVYDPELVQDDEKSNVGICDLKWDSKSRKVCVSYRGVSSVIIDWN